MQYLEAHESLALPEEALGPAGLQAKGKLGIAQGLCVALQLLVAKRTIPKEPEERSRAQDHVWMTFAWE